MAALHIAAEEGHNAVVRELLAKGANIEAVDHDGRTALQIAAEEGHGAVVRELPGQLRAGLVGSSSELMPQQRCRESFLAW